MADDKKTLELQIRVAAGEALRAVASLKGEMQSLAGEMRKLSESDGAAVKRTFEETQAAADKAAASMKLFGASSGELRQMQARLKDAAAEVVARGFDPQSEEVKKLVEEYKRLGKEAGELDRAAGKNISSFGDLKNALGSLAQVAALVKTLDVIKDMGTFALSTADTFRTARNEFGTLLGDMQAGAGLFNQIKAFNDKTPFSLDTLTQATKVLLTAKVPLAELQNQLTKIGDLSQGNSQRFAGYASAFGKAAAKGRADMEILNVYINQGVPILEALGKQFGVLEDEVVEMAGQGKISFEDFSAALDDLTAEGGGYFDNLRLASESLSATQEGLREVVNSLAASFGEALFPAAIGVLKALTGLTDAINDSPIAKGVFAAALVSVTGYLTAMAVKAAAAFAAQMKLNLAVGALVPAIAASTAVVAAIVGGYTIYASIQQKATREAEDFAYQQRQQADAVNGSAAALQKYSRALEEMPGAKHEQRALVLQRVIDAIKRNLQQLDAAYNLSSLNGRENLAEGWSNRTGQERRNLDSARAELAKATEEYIKERNDWIDLVYSGTEAGKTEAVLRGLNSDLAAAQKFLTELGPGDERSARLTTFIKEATAAIDKLNNSAGGSKRTWQSWFGEITKTDPALFKEEGTEAARLYLEALGQSVKESGDLSAALGEKLDPASVLRGQQEEIRKTIIDLLSIKPENIDEPFTLASKSIGALAQRFKEIGADIRGIEYQPTLDGLRKKIEDLGKSENDLALESAKAAGASEDELAAYKALMDEYGRKSVLESYRQQVEGLTQDKYDLARASLAAAGATEEEKRRLEEYIAALKEADAEGPLEKMRKGTADFQQSLSDSMTLWLANTGRVGEKTAVTLGDLTAQLVSLSSAATLGGLEELGRAMAEGADASEVMGRALAETAQQILRQLPMMFLQAGLQLVINGNWPLGLSFIAAAGSSAIISGWTEGMAAQAKEEAKENAKGGVYNEYGAVAREYAAGGAFTNRIVSRPTYFRYGGGLGLMGEAGPEAIMPLARGSDGRIGVISAGGGSAVYVVIQNYTGQDVRTEESSDSSGNQIRRIIIGTVRQGISSGEMDQSLSGRYGLRARGV
jgi:tape measure domain-containing protein